MQYHVTQAFQGTTMQEENGWDVDQTISDYAIYPGITLILKRY